MSSRGDANLTLVFVLCTFPALACSCANYTPIQASYEGYRERAIFTARVVQLLGPAYHWDGKRSSSMVLAIVHHRYWGLPWYWPAIVVLDGSYPCDIAMSAGEEYLVSGRRGRYGVLDVNSCSRTQPIADAQVDLRTLDGSRCASPGGTIVGRITQPIGNRREPVRNATLTYRDSFGRAYVARGDQEGIYELRHLPAGTYKLDSQFSPGLYVVGGANVVPGMCRDSPVYVNNYHISLQGV